MELFSTIVNIPGFNVVRVEVREGTVVLSLEAKTDHGVCPHCGTSSQRVRVWYPRLVRDLPISGQACYLQFATRYFTCETCQATFAEPLPFVEAKRDYTTRYEASIFEQVRHTTVAFVATREGLTDQVVSRIFLRQANARLPEFPFMGVKRLGIDEIAERKGKKAYDLVLYNLDTGKPLDMLENRTQAELMAYFDRLPGEHIRHIEEVCIDMWRPYATAVTEKLSHAKLVTDRFHVMKAVNEELKSLKNTLKKALPDDAKACHYPLLKNETDLTDPQQKILDKVYEASPQLKEAHQLKEAFRDIVETADSVEEGSQALQGWLDKADQAHLFSEAVKTIRNWFDSIVNYFYRRTTNGPAEGINNKITVIKRMAYGFRNFAHFRLRILAAFL